MSSSNIFENDPSENKMKFLDNLFDTKSELKAYDSTIDASYYYTKLSESVNQQNNNINNAEVEYNVRGNVIIMKSPKLWLGVLLSFFMLCFIFRFKLIMIIPLLFITGILYVFFTMTKAQYTKHMDIIRKIIKIKGKIQI